MSKSIKLAVLYPSHLNLNGDAANFDVLHRRLEWFGISSEVHSIHKPTDLESYDFVLLGHGSSDAWRELNEIEPDLVLRLVALVRSGKPVMAVSSGYEILFEALNGTTTKHSERVSEFKDSDGVVGYVNSEAQLPELTWFESSLMTLFHGPVFAKNPELADRFLGDVIRGARLDASEIAYVNELAVASRKVAFED